MANNFQSSAPKPQTEAEKQLVELLEGGKIRPEFARELLEGMSETHNAAKSVMSSKELEPDKRISFAEAVKLLEGKLDLEVARTDAVKSHGRYGLVDALIKAGAINDASEYGALFDKATVSEDDLHKVLESLERGEKILPIFDAGEMTPDELFAVLFTEGGVPHYTESFGFKNLAKLRRIDPKDIPDLQNLHEKSYDEQLAAFKAAYKEADALEPTGPRVTFTPDKLEVTRVNISAVEDMQDFAKGKMTFIDPSADFLRYRAQMDEGLRKIAGRRGNFDGLSNEAYRALLDKAFADKTIDEYMPDREKVTHYPNYAFESGGVPFLSFGAAARKVGVSDYSPVDAFDDLGCRISLG